ncbi:MAG: hypothetical protein NWE95_11815 [Candidatus Bathyarchaeota archaeon]|nr:hypothetical protein [Candidatus Bathyarchaeota archaeon]
MDYEALSLFTLIAKALGVRKDIMTTSMDAVLGCMNVLTTDYSNKSNKHKEKL